MQAIAPKFSVAWIYDYLKSRLKSVKHTRLRCSMLNHRVSSNMIERRLSKRNIDDEQLEIAADPADFAAAQPGHLFVRIRFWTHLHG